MLQYVDLNLLLKRTFYHVLNWWFEFITDKLHVGRGSSLRRISIYKGKYRAMGSLPLFPATRQIVYALYTYSTMLGVPTKERFFFLLVLQPFEWQGFNIRYLSFYNLIWLRLVPHLAEISKLEARDFQNLRPAAHVPWVWVGEGT